MSSITAQQTKLDLELVPKENRLDIKKCNGRIPHGLKTREPTFVPNALALNPCYSAFLITVDVPEVYMCQFWNFVPEMKESKAYKTYLGYRSGVVPPRIARKFKKASPSKKDSSLVPVDGEPTKKGKRVKRPAKKSTTTSAAGIFINEDLVKTESKRKEKVDVARDFEQDTNGSKSESESDQQEYEEEVKDDDDEEDEVVHTLSNSDDEDGVNLKSNNDDKIEGDEDKGMDDATNQFNDDVDARLNEPTQTDKEETVVPVAISSYSSDLALKFLHFADIHHNDAEIVSLLDVHVHHEVPSTHTSTLLTVPVSIIPESSPVCTTIPQSSQTFTSSLLLKTPKPPSTIKTTNTPSTIPDFALVFQFNERVNAIEKEVAELKKDPLHTQVTALVDDHLDTRMRATREEFMNFLSASLITRITKQVKNQLPQILPEEVSNFAPHVIEKMIKESLNQANLAKTRKDAKPTTGPKIKDSTSSSTKGTKSQPKSSGKTVQSEEPEFEVGEIDMPQDQEGNLGNDD
nr:hypothetical protein [Tanacetum cinerariifolium]